MTERGEGRPKSFDRTDWGSLDAEQARYLRRRIQFWKSVAGMLGLGIALAVVVFFVRRSTFVDRCRASLDHYGRVAEALKLSQFDTAMLTLQWRNLDPAKDGYPASHYQIVPQNWAATPKEGEEIPLAVCEEVHGTITGGGRNVLYRTPKGMLVRFVDEPAAAEIAAQGVRGERMLPQVR